MINFMGDGIGGPVIKCMSGNAFELYVSHFRKDNSDDYDKVEKIIIADTNEFGTTNNSIRTQEQLEQAVKGKFVTCDVQYRDKKTDALVCNIFIQNPPEGF